VIGSQRETKAYPMKMAMTPKERTQNFMKIAIEKGFEDMAYQMNDEELELLVKSLTREPNKSPE
jgi:hypothetical protein